jgi:hypothetical protein
MEPNQRITDDEERRKSRIVLPGTGEYEGVMEGLKREKGRVSDEGVGEESESNTKAKGIEGRVDERQGDEGQNVLVFSLQNKIYVIDKDSSISLVMERDDEIDALCSHEGVLYDAGFGELVRETLTGKYAVRLRPKIVPIRLTDRALSFSKRGYSTFALCSNNGRLYDAGSWGTVTETMMGKTVSQMREPHIYTLCSHKGVLYHAGEEGLVKETMTGEEIAERRYNIYSLCSHNDVLYDGGDGGIIRETFSGKEVAIRDCVIDDLCSHNGVLYDVGYGGVISEAFSGKKVVQVSGGKISSLCSHPRSDLVNAGVLK